MFASLTLYFWGSFKLLPKLINSAAFENIRTLKIEKGGFKNICYIITSECFLMPEHFDMFCCWTSLKRCSQVVEASVFEVLKVQIITGLPTGQFPTCIISSLLVWVVCQMTDFPPTHIIK